MIAVWALTLFVPVAEPEDRPSDTEPLAEARNLVDELRCDRAIEALEPVIPTLDAAQRREGLFLLGYCLAALGRGLDADARFREAFVIDLDAPLGFPAEPNIQFIIDGARQAVRAQREEARRAARDALRAEVKIEASAPLRIQGGRRLPIAATLLDPNRRVTRLFFEFRREKEKDAFTLPMQRDSEGTWRGEVPGLYTLTPDGAFTMTWRVIALDDEGVLTESSSAASPQSTYVSEDESLVPELRANERLPHPQRVLYASLGFGAAVVFTGLATAVTGSLLAMGAAQPAFGSTGAASDTSWSGRELLFKAIAAGAPLAATTGVAYAAMDPLIDGGWKLLPPLIVFGSAIPSAAAALILDPSTFDYPFWVIALGLGAGGTGTFAAAVAATVIVSLDTPNSVHGE